MFSPVNLLCSFRPAFSKNASGGLLENGVAYEKCGSSSKDSFVYGTIKK